MKRGILVATLMMTVAGVASARLLTAGAPGAASPHRVTASQARPAIEPPPVTAGADRPAIDQSTARPEPAAPAKVTSAQVTRKSLVEAHQAPVPFRMKPRPPVNLPPAAGEATDVKAAEGSTDPAATDESGQNAARAAIEADGYKGVKVLRKGANGVWHASALRGSTTVMLTVDSSGSVSAD